MRKTISFTEEYAEEYQYVCEQHDYSDYIRKLVRKDRLKEKDSLEERIIKLLQQIVAYGPAKYNKIHNDNKRKSLDSILKMGK
jgi:predicted CopG family antitoxin